MRFYVDTDERKSMRIEVKEAGKSVDIVGQDTNGKLWTIISFLPDGTFKKGVGIPDDLGMQTNDDGSIVETLNRDAATLKKFADTVKEMGFDAKPLEPKKLTAANGTFDIMRDQITQIVDGRRNGDGEMKNEIRLIVPQAASPETDLVPGQDYTHKLVSLADLEKIHIDNVLNVVEGNQTYAAKILGIGLRTLNRKTAMEREKGNNGDGEEVIEEHQEEVESQVASSD